MRFLITDIFNTPIKIIPEKLYSRIISVFEKGKTNKFYSLSIDKKCIRRTISPELLELSFDNQECDSDNEYVKSKIYSAGFYVVFGQTIDIMNDSFCSDVNNEYYQNLYVHDVKWLWELSRAQFLPRFALKNYSKDVSEFDPYIVKNWFLKYMNPSFQTDIIKWTSTMDVAIRAANISMALNMLVDSPKFEISKDETEKVAGYLYSHVQFIRQFPEKKQGLGNNHYLANLVGLMYAAYPLELDNFLKKSTQWAVKELLIELDKQFLNDGGNFESSTTYHCFSSEMAIYGLAMIDRMSDDKEFDWLNIDDIKLKRVKLKLKKASDMIKWLVHENDQIVQMGDNDSGRFFRWSAYGQTMNNKEAEEKYASLKGLTEERDPDGIYFDEDMLNQRAIMDLGEGYFSKEKQKSIEGMLIQQIRGEVDHGDLTYSIAEPEKAYKGSRTFDFQENNLMIVQDENQPSIIENLTHKFFPNMGLYVFKSDRIHLIINGMNRHVKQYWPHGHNDKLSFELYLDGKPIVRDPGSFTYTGDYKLRNLYRSEKAHNVPRHNEPQNKWPDGKAGVFRMIPKSKVEVVDFSSNSLSLHLSFGKVKHIRTWVIHNDRLEIIDQSNKAFEIEMIPEILFSNGYGKMLNEGY